MRVTKRDKATVVVMALFNEFEGESFQTEGQAIRFADIRLKSRHQLSMANRKARLPMAVLDDQYKKALKTINFTK